MNWIRSLLLAAMAVGPQAAWGATAVYIDSPAGEPVGQGQQYTFTSPASTISASVSNGRVVAVTFDGWQLVVEPKPGAPLVPGNYEHSLGGFAEPFGPLPSLFLTAPGSNCEKAVGWFEVHEAVFDGDTVTSLALDFLQNCYTGKYLFGAVRINSDVPLARPEPYARVVVDPQEWPNRVAMEGERLNLRAAPSFDRASGINTYEWVQISGTPVIPDGPSNPNPAFVFGFAPQVAPGGETLQFQLTVTDAEGYSDSQVVDVTVHDVADARTLALYFDVLPSGDIQFPWFGNFDEDNSTIHAEVAGDSLSAAIENEFPHAFEFTPAPGSSLQPGTQIGTVFRRIGEFSCTDPTGQLEVIELETSGNTVTRLAADFTSHCPGAQNGTFYPIRINSDVPVDSDADGANDREDAFPFSPSETTDSDGDGVGDNADAFDNDPTETTDSDGDGVGNNADAFDNDPTETTDSDGDGVGNNADAFDNDPTETTDSDGDGVGNNADAFDNDPTETMDSDGDGVGNNADAFDNDPSETTDSDGDGVGNNADAFDNDPAESADTDHDGTGNNADADDDDDGEPDSTESLAPNGDGNADGIPDSLQPNVTSFLDNSGAAATIAVAGGTLRSAHGLANPSTDPLPSGFSFDRGFFGVDIEVPPGGAATATLRLHTGAAPETYFKYGSVGGGAIGYYEFTYNGATGAELLPGMIVLHLVDGARGDADGMEDGVITDPGAPAWIATNPPHSGGGGGGSPSCGLLAAFAALAALRRRLRR